MSDPIRTLVAGVSHIADDDPTLAAAAELARWTGAELHLVHAMEFPPLFAAPGVELDAPPASELYVSRQRAELEAVARRVPGGETAACHVVVGRPAKMLTQAAEQLGAGLVIVGAAHRGLRDRGFLGTTAQRVLRSAATPVLVVRRPLHRPLQRVLLTTELSDLSAAVHERAVDTIEHLFGGDPEAARSMVVMALPFVPPPLPHDTMDRAARAGLEAFVRARRPRGPEVEPVVRSGPPAVAIVAEAEEWDADLLVVGTHARGWAGRLMLGSVAEAVLRDAPCNVLAVPPRALALSAPAPRLEEAEDLVAATVG